MSQQKPFEVALVKIDDEVNQELHVLRNGEVVRLECDRMEPEDNLFYRDWKWVPDAIREAYAYGLEDGRGCVAVDDWGCDARKKLGVARGAMMTASEQVEELLAALHPVMMAHCQSNEAHRLFLDVINKLDAAVEATGQPQLCDTKEKK